jgi:hypothetical protein
MASIDAIEILLPITPPHDCLAHDWLVVPSVRRSDAAHKQG